jgi:hypothetical protein
MNSQFNSVIKRFSERNNWNARSTALLFYRFTNDNEYLCRIDVIVEKSKPKIDGMHVRIRFIGNWFKPLDRENV